MIKFINIILPVWLILNQPFVLAQHYTISGKITDASNGSPIAGADVLVSGLNNGAVSDYNGEYVLKELQKGSYLLKVCYFGYTSQEKQVTFENEKINIDFSLKESSYDLDAIVVTGTRTEKTLKNSPVLTQVVNQYQIEKLGATNATDALQLAVPNISLYSNGAVTTMNMQGLNSKYILFLIDGERIAGEVRDNMDYSRLNISNVEKIEIVNGASSSLYGSNAIGGVINIITRKNNEPFEANIHARLTKYNDLVTGTNFGFKFNKISTYTDFLFKRTDGFDLTPDSTKDLWTMEPFRDFTVNQKITYQASNKLNFNILGSYYSHERFDVSSVPKHPYYNDLSGSFKADYQPTFKTKFEASYHSDKYQIFDILERLSNEKVRTYSDLVNNARISGLFNFNTGQVVDNHQLTTGLEYLGESLFSDRIENMEKSNYNLVLFAQHDLKIKPGINTIAGLRIDKNSEFGTWFSPKISAMYNVKSFNFRASYGLGFRAPSLKERYFKYHVPVGFDLIGNPKLKSENSRYISGSIELIRENYNGSISVYNNYLNDMIHDTWDTGVPNLVTYRNINEARVTGIDLIYRTKLIYGFSMGGGYSFVDAKDLTAKTALEGTNKHTANISLEYTFRKLNYFLNINLQGRVLSEKNYQTYLGNEFLIRIFPAYSIWKITTMQKFYNYFNLTMGVDNLFNYKNTFEPDIVFIDPGRRLFIGLNIRLDKGIINLFNKHK